jgi:hypothetical protein
MFLSLSRSSYVVLEMPKLRFGVWVAIESLAIFSYQQVTRGSGKSPVIQLTNPLRALPLHRMTPRLEERYSRGI